VRRFEAFDRRRRTYMFYIHVLHAIQAILHNNNETVYSYLDSNPVTKLALLLI